VVLELPVADPAEEAGPAVDQAALALAVVPGLELEGRVLAAVPEVPVAAVGSLPRQLLLA